MEGSDALPGTAKGRKKHQLLHLGAQDAGRDQTLQNTGNTMSLKKETKQTARLEITPELRVFRSRGEVNRKPLAIPT